MGLNEGQYERTAMYWNNIVVAVSSAKAKAPSLQPVLVWLSAPNERTRWFEKAGGIVLYHKLTFLDKLEAAVSQGFKPPEWLQAAGVWARLDVPGLTRHLQERFDPQEFELDYVLYTDVDVMFYKDVNSCSLERPRYLRYGSEDQQQQGPSNTGVMYMNVTAMLHQQEGLLAAAEAAKWDTQAFDQGLINDYFEGRADFLPDELNWKVYWGTNPAAAIIHFHGPKPSEPCVRCFLDDPQRPTDFWVVVRIFEQRPECGCINPAYPAMFGGAMQIDNLALFREADALYHAYLAQA